VRLLLDTHFIIWSIRDRERFSPALATRLTDPANTLVFSVATIWEIAIKHAQGRADFVFDPVVIRPGLIAQGYEELPILIHRDPFDRLLVAQANYEGITLLTADPMVAQYPGPIELTG